VISLPKLRWVAIGLPAAFLIGLEMFRSLVLESVLAPSLTRLAVLGAMLMGVVVFSVAIFRVLEAMQRRIVHQNLELLQLHREAERRGQQLEALNEAGISMTEELSLEAVLQKVVDFSRGLVRAQYGALSVFDEDGAISQFITSGITAEEKAKIGHLPEGRGVLGIIKGRDKPLRLANIAEHPQSAGFPPHHPPMKSFMGVPIVYKGRVLGSLYLTNKEGAQEFSQEDEDVMTMFATQAAIAIENAILYEKVQSLAVMEERDRIGKELHDGIIQSIYAIGLGLEDTAHQLGDVSPEVKDRLNHSLEDLNDVIRDIRNYILDLRPQMLQGKTLVQGLEELAMEFRANSVLDLELRIDAPHNVSLPLEATLNLLQIAREGLTNVIKHASGTKVVVTLKAQNGTLEMLIEDDGTGFDTKAPRSSHRQGLRNMEQRAQALGGKLTVESAPHRGTRLRLTLSNNS